MNTPTKKIEHAQKMLKELPVAITGLEALERMVDTDMSYKYGSVDTDESLDFKNTIKRSINRYGNMYLAIVTFLEKEGINPYPLNDEWWSQKENREWAARWGLKRKPWWKRLFSKQR
ncbi:hypothetical protein [Sunxiuqinia dokdonensis]|uniref:Uncharacterized protein n=1 Tax=Sunxiuqinia dokdonensis TaxID=1409788 RepID=A0A0L8VFW3_9BACT|nr:hypothetical protein [Sunxiuqinia dokdonensis]KOH47067.1 hypothetical protein NC99_01100 [Sunxiuqinia dokdonensis]